MKGHVTAVLKLKVELDPREALALLADYANATFGEGGNAEAANIEGFVGICNTPVYGGYFTVLVSPAYAQALEYIALNGGNPVADLIRVEWPQIADEETGIVPDYPTITYDVWDADGVVTQQPIGVI